MRRNGFIRLIALLLICLFALAGCKRRIEPKNRVFYEYFNTVSTLYDYSGEADGQFRENAAFVGERLRYYHELFDIYNEYEGVVNLAGVNRLAPSGEVEVSAELISFLEYAVEIYYLTDGNTNIAMGSVLSIWHDYRTEGVAVPPSEELRSAAEHTDITKLVIDAEKSTVAFLDPEMSLDVGAIAKGYAAERIAEELIERGVSSYVLDIGGNLRAIGEKPDGSGWRTGIKNPDLSSKEPYIYYLDVSDESVVTSGNYERYYTVDGVRYHHIINKDTLFPANYFASVTVICADSGLADALSTALFNTHYESGVEILSELEEVSCIWVTLDGELLKYGLDD